MRSYIVAPGKGLQLTATIEWDHPMIGRQSASFVVTPETFRARHRPGADLRIRRTRSRDCSSEGCSRVPRRRWRWC